MLGNRTSTCLPELTSAEGGHLYTTVRPQAKERRACETNDFPGCFGFLASNKFLFMFVSFEQIVHLKTQR